ncbi:nanos homolog 3 [Notechis scutatus]|uniref:Nanos homolog 3 n=1 Tax=Notechis scutatus TaxID=8663 RepID=A0A6J1V3D2_9SAUR|nr:nanos homolog 3 [Notechis scutatus]
MSPAAFQLWRDYFQLAKLVEEMNRYGPSEEESGPQAAELSPERQQERQLFPRRRRQQQQQQRRQQLVDESPSAARGRDEFSCSFCKQNGESRSIYSSHRLKDEAGRVQCPILRKYKCPQCGASEDFAHTRRFCPLTKEGYISVYTSFIRNSAGKRKKKPVVTQKMMLGYSETIYCGVVNKLDLSEVFVGIPIHENNRPSNKRQTRIPEWGKTCF